MQEVRRQSWGVSWCAPRAVGDTMAVLAIFVVADEYSVARYARGSSTPSGSFATFGRVGDIIFYLKDLKMLSHFEIHKNPCGFFKGPLRILCGFVDGLAMYGLLEVLGEQHVVGVSLLLTHGGTGIPPWVLRSS